MNKWSKLVLGAALAGFLSSHSLLANPPAATDEHKEEGKAGCKGKGGCKGKKGAHHEKGAKASCKGKEKGKAAEEHQAEGEEHKN